MRTHTRTALIAAAATAPVATAQIALTDLASERGFTAYNPAPGMSTGVIAADFDNDGDTDVFVPNGRGHADQLYRNLGNGHFEEVAETLGIDSTDNNRAALWFDYDGDNDLDLIVVSDTFQTEQFPVGNKLTLYRFDAPETYTDVTAAAGMPDITTGGYDVHAGGVSAGDLDNDGDLDLVIALWEGVQQTLINNANGTFTPLPTANGLATNVINAEWQPLLHDLDRDGRIDVVLSVDFDDNLVFRNTGNDANALPTFQDIAANANANSAFNEMGIAHGDPDNDNDIDLYMTNIFGNDPANGQPEFNILLRNDSTPLNIQFTELAQQAGVDNGGIGWGAAFADLDNDAWQELLEANITEPFVPATTKLWRNDGGAFNFTDISEASGFATFDPCAGLVTFDADLDGDLDILMPSLAENRIHFLDNQLDHTNRNHLAVKLRAPGMNRRAIGATVSLTLPDGTTSMRLITAGTSFAGQEPAAAFFGLAEHTTAKAIRIVWPDATSTTLRNVPANQILTVNNPCPCGYTHYDTDNNNVFNDEDLYDFYANPSDVNLDGITDQTDTDCITRFHRRHEHTNTVRQRLR